MKAVTRSLLVGVLCTAAFMFLPPAGDRAQAGAPQIPQHLLKLDGLLRLDVAKHTDGKRRVLIRVSPAERQALQQLLESQGHDVVGQSESGDTLTVIVAADALEGLAKSTRVLGV